MAWLYKRGGMWWVGYRLNNKLKARSTKTADKKKAEEQLAQVEMMFGAAKVGILTDEVYQGLTGSSLPTISLWTEIDDWLAECRASIAPNTVARYGSVGIAFKKFLSATPAAPILSKISADDVRGYLISVRGKNSATTVNVERGVLSALFSRAVNNRHLKENPVAFVKKFVAARGEVTKRRAFTVEELRAVYAQAPSDFWRYMILGEFYSGLRLGDLVCLEWKCVDFASSFITVTPGKVSSRELHIPLARPLRAILEARRRETDGTGLIWPDQAALYRKQGSAPFSHQFFSKVLLPCGLAKKRDYTKGGKLPKGDLTFHSLRHSFVSYLKATGANQSIAKELAGHSSDAVNDRYTHNAEEALTKAIDRLPEFV